ncbi:MAG: hypothetical protein V1652_03310 [bacterium]
MNKRFIIFFLLLGLFFLKSNVVYAVTYPAPKQDSFLLNNNIYQRTAVSDIGIGLNVNGVQGINSSSGTATRWLGYGGTGKITGDINPHSFNYNDTRTYALNANLVPILA